MRPRRSSGGLCRELETSALGKHSSYLILAHELLREQRWKDFLLVIWGSNARRKSKTGSHSCINGCYMRSSHLCSPHTERLCVSQTDASTLRKTGGGGQ